MRADYTIVLAVFGLCLCIPISRTLAGNSSHVYIDAAFERALKLKADCKSIKPTPLSLALMATEDTNRDFYDHAIDFSVRHKTLATWLKFEQRSLGPAQIKPATLLEYDLLPNSTSRQASLELIGDDCASLAYVNLLTLAYSEEGNPCWSQLVREHSDKDVCAIREFNGQNTVNRQNFAYVGLVLHVADTLTADFGS